MPSKRTKRVFITRDEDGSRSIWKDRPSDLYLADGGLWWISDSGNPVWDDWGGLLTPCVKDYFGTRNFGIPKGRSGWAEVPWNDELERIWNDA